MDAQYEPVRRLMANVRGRYRALTACRAIARAALAASAAVGLALAAASLIALVAGGTWMLAIAGIVALFLVVAGVVWGLMPLRHAPSDARIARYIEERVPALDDRLTTAVDVASLPAHKASPILAAPLMADAARRACEVELDDVVPPQHIRRSGLRAAAAAFVFLVMAVVAREPAKRSVDAASLVFFPTRARIEVRPGDATLKSGSGLQVEARIAGNEAPASARVEVLDGGGLHGSAMTAAGSGFRASIPPATADFKYRVVIGSLKSREYQVRVVTAPHVARIDVDYVYPPSLGLRPRTEIDGGDLYAPAGTEARLRIQLDRPAATGSLTMSNGASLALAMTSPTEMTATMKVAGDGSYRVSVADRDGLTDGPQTEYFIRVLDDRPPDVHIVKPAADRPVTPLEEVDIEAQADDDFGLDRVELVFAVRGQSEQVVPLGLASRATSATVRHTLYLEDLGVKPGDFVSYYVRARDIGRSARSNEGRSDIFFLEVRPYEQEFALQQSQSMAGAGNTGSIDDLVNAQKQIVVATWKLDRRGGGGIRDAKSPQDIRAVGRSEDDLKTRVEETASTLRESTMRDPRRRMQGRAADPADGVRFGQAMPEEDELAKAAEAMGRAAASLNGLNTTTALPPEMQALNALLSAQALVKKRQISREQSAQGGPGNNNRNYDISTLFDKELQRLQETNYETRPASRPDNGSRDGAIERLRELAKRQDELVRRQEELARQQLPDEERKRQLEKLTREQSELRQQLEEAARQQESKLPGSQSRQLEEIAGDMSRARGRQALEKLRSLERQLSGNADKDAAARAKELRGRLEALDRELKASGSAAQRKQLLEEASRELQRAGDLVGLTFEGRGMTLSSPGTEGFKQDLGKWEQLRDQATRALTALEPPQPTDRTGDRLAAGIDDRAPASYRSRVDDYFKAIAAKKTP